MAYCIEADIDKIYGTENVAKWSDLDNDADASKMAACVARAIATADKEIDRRLRGTHYTVPFSTVPDDIMHISATIAGYHLHGNRGRLEAGRGSPDALKSRYDWAVVQLAEIKSGVQKLDAV